VLEEQERKVQVEAVIAATIPPSWAINTGGVPPFVWGSSTLICLNRFLFVIRHYPKEKLEEEEKE
jgi:hypothetical protein